MTKPIRAVIADDEPLARRTLEGLLAKDPEIELVASCANGYEAVKAVRELAPDLLWLDVQMPGMNGFEVLDELGEDCAPRVVFVTAYDEYALRAFEVHAIDYLLKPFDDERFGKALGRAKEQLAREAGAGMGPAVADLLVAREGAPGLIQSQPGQPHQDQPLGADSVAPLERISIAHEGKIDIVELAELLWIEAADQYVRLHTQSAVHLMRESMARLERQLDERRFLRVHRSAIIALWAVRTYESTGAGCGRVQLSDGTWVPVSRARAASVRSQIRRSGSG